MLYYLLNGAVLGLTAGLTPGPLMTLLIAESLRGGWPAGFRVSLAPLFTDTVLILLALLIAAPLPHWALSAIGVVGGGIIIWMGWGTVRSAGAVLQEAAATSEGGRGSLGKAIATNLVNPNAFLFWLTVGGPILRDAFTARGANGPAAFMLPFFGIMISINLIVALSVSRGRHLLGGAGYRWTLRAAGVMLALLGAWRIWTGISQLI